jgi:hypothetical protein
MSVTHESAKPGALWYNRFVPESPRGDYYLGDPELSVPRNLVKPPYEADPLRDMLPELEAAFTSFWDAECARIEAWGGLVVGNRKKLTAEEQAQTAMLPKGQSLIDKADKRRAFWSEARFVSAVAGTVLQAYKEDHLSEVILLNDLDDSIISIPEPSTDVEYAKQTSTADGAAMIVRPGLAVVARYLEAQPGIHLTVGVISTKRQGWLNKTFWPTIQQKCPDVFRDESLLISSTDGTIAQQLERERAAIGQGVLLSELYGAERASDYAILPQAMRLVVSAREARGSRPLRRLRSLTTIASDPDLKPAVIARLKGTDRGAAACIVWVDDWPGAELVNNTHSDFRAVPLSAYHAQFELADKPDGLKFATLG